MAKPITILFGAALALGISGCASKREPLPPAPSETPPPPPAPTGDTTPTDTVVPGSRADFQRSVTSDTVNFGYDQYDLDSQAQAILDSQVAWLTRFPNVTITIEGHCDERGTREYNLALGDRRANAAKNYLAAHGIAASRITTISYGKERPLALASDEASWAQNRRAVTVVLN